MAERITTYTDAAGRPHAVDLVEHLVVDRGLRDVRVVCVLEEDEGRDQAFAVLEAGGYLERARQAEGPLCCRPSKDELRLLAADRRRAEAEAGEPGLARAA